MRKIKFFTIVLVAVGVLLLQTAPAMAARGCNVAEDITWLDAASNVKAPGTKLYTTIAIKYGPVEGEPLQRVMSYMLRVSKGNQLYSFSGPPVTVVFDDFAGQLSAISAFISDTVLPLLYACDTVDNPVCPTFELKSNSDFIENDDSQFNSICEDEYNNWICAVPSSDHAGFDFMFADIVIAVVE